MIPNNLIATSGHAGPDQGAEQSSKAIDYQPNAVDHGRRSKERQVTPCPSGSYTLDAIDIDCSTRHTQSASKGLYLSLEEHHLHLSTEWCQML